MAQRPDVERMLHRARLLLQEGQNDLVLEGLEAIHADNKEQQQEIAYLRGSAYLMIGKESLTKAKGTEGQQQRELLGEAIGWFEKAQKQFSLTRKRDNVADTKSQAVIE